MHSEQKIFPVGNCGQRRGTVSHHIITVWEAHGYARLCVAPAVVPF